MIKKVIFAGILLCLLIAIPLALLGYERVSLGPSFLAFMKSVNSDLNSFKIEIPNIPSIPKFDNASGGLVVLNVLIDFINMLVVLINALSSVINVVIQLLQFLFLVIKNLIFFKDSIAANNPLPVV